MADKVYAIRRNGIEHGTVYTSAAIVSFMLNEVKYVSEYDLRDVTLLDPATGDGVFILEAIKRLFKSSIKYEFDFVLALKNLKAVELDEGVATKLKSKIIDYCESVGFKLTNEIINSLVLEGDFLLVSQADLGKEFKIIIGNPPYIRHEEIPENKKIQYRSLFKTFRHRSDIYVAFYEKALELLTDDGSVCYICSNRWMKTKYGEPLRTMISEDYSLDAIIDVSDKSAFDQDVDAYASITLISKEKTLRKYFYYEHIDNLSNLKPITFDDEVGINILEKPKNGEWHIGESRLFAISENYKPIEAQGFKLGIGVASGADKIYISQDLPIEKDLQLPIITAREIMNGEINWKGKFIFNPYSGSGGLINLDDYPLAKSYLEEHSDTLKKRHTVKNNTSNAWYKTIDRIYPELTNKPKLLIPDMKRDGLFPIDEGRFYPHHNIYYITHTDIELLKVLGAFLISDFSREQINLVSVKMRGGFARWQSQNLRRVVLPELSDLKSSMKKKLQAAYDSKDTALINKLVNTIVSPSQ